MDSTLFLKPLLPDAGCAHAPLAATKKSADMAYGLSVARQIAGMDIGQTIVVFRAKRASRWKPWKAPTKPSRARAHRCRKTAGGRESQQAEAGYALRCSGGRLAHHRYDEGSASATASGHRRASARCCSIAKRLIAAADEAGIAIQAFAPAAGGTRSRASEGRRQE